MRRCEKMSMMSFNSYSYEEHVLSIDIYAICIHNISCCTLRRRINRINFVYVGGIPLVLYEKQAVKIT